MPAMLALTRTLWNAYLHYSDAVLQYSSTSSLAQIFLHIRITLITSEIQKCNNHYNIQTSESFQNVHWLHDQSRTNMWNAVAIYTCPHLWMLAHVFTDECSTCPHVEPCARLQQTYGT